MNISFVRTGGHQMAVPCPPPDYQGCIRRDQVAPEFQAEAYLNGNRVMVNSKDYAGKWLVIFFYSSDFTFV